MSNDNYNFPGESTAWTQAYLSAISGAYAFVGATTAGCLVDRAAQVADMTVERLEARTAERADRAAKLFNAAKEQVQQTGSYVNVVTNNVLDVFEFTGTQVVLLERNTERQLYITFTALTDPNSALEEYNLRAAPEHANDSERERSSTLVTMKQRIASALQPVLGYTPSTPDIAVDVDGNGWEGYPPDGPAIITDVRLKSGDCLFSMTERAWQLLIDAGLPVARERRSRPKAQGQERS